MATSILYKLGAWAYRLAVASAAPFDGKARARSRGAATALDLLPYTPAGQRCYWMHCASVGEFEQGRPLWNRLRAARPEARFVLSFFSPSGYEHFAGRPGLGEVVYLPWDGGRWPRRFVARLSPTLAVFVKYEWWLGYFAALRSSGTHTIVVSAAFRQNQPFFRGRPPHRNAFADALRGVDHIFVQSERSARLLEGLDYARYTINGDTRLDRVLHLAGQNLDAPPLEAWVAGYAHVLVAGSTWPEDEQFLAAALLEDAAYGVLLAPHEVSPADLDAAEARLRRVLGHEAVVRLSELYVDPVRSARIVLVDRLGLLSKLYRLGTVAYVGGGFGAGIHNTLEPLAYRLPVAFGPNHERFDEAQALLAAGVATEIRGTDDLTDFLHRHTDDARRAAVAGFAEAYLRMNRGATDRIWGYLTECDLV